MAIRWKQSPVVGLVLVAIIVIALIFIIRGMAPKKYYYTGTFGCEECGVIFEKKLDVARQKFPIKCPECGKMAAYRAVQCMDCGHIFVHKPFEPTEEKPYGPRVMPTCPECGSYNIGLIRKKSE